MTTLVSSSCKSSTSAGCLHSCTEAVHFASLSFFGLVSSFHFSFSLCLRHLTRAHYCLIRVILYILNIHQITYYLILSKYAFKVKCLQLYPNIFTNLLHNAFLTKKLILRVPLRRKLNFTIVIRKNLRTKNQNFRNIAPTLRQITY